MMGFDAGILKDVHNPLWDYRPEFDADLELHRKSTDPTIWLRDSVVWYSQQITRKLGMERFQRYVDGFAYGNRDLTGNAGKGDGLTQAWLMSSLRISTEEQVQLIRRFFAETLPVSKRACELTRASTPSFSAEGGWAVQGKTGSGFLRDKKGNLDRSRPLGWFVGWAEKDGRRVAFARLEVGNMKMDSYGGPVAKAALLAGLSTMIGAS
jgi:beta-lactamase class D